MNDIDTMTIGDAKEAVSRGKQIEAALGIKATATAEPHSGGTDHGLQIVILDRGFVFVGDVSTDGDWVTISNAKNVRRWGTSQGLGELAARGPQPETKLDIGGTIKAPHRALIGMIACEVASWKR
jgi:hypothetical protein